MNYKETCELAFEAEASTSHYENLLALCSFTHIRFIALILCMNVRACVRVFTYGFIFVLLEKASI